MGRLGQDKPAFGWELEQRQWLQLPSKGGLVLASGLPIHSLSHSCRRSSQKSKSCRLSLPPSSSVSLPPWASYSSATASSIRHSSLATVRRFSPTCRGEKRRAFMMGGREGGREGWREGEREGEREGGREGERESAASLQPAAHS